MAADLAVFEDAGFDYKEYVNRLCDEAPEDVPLDRHLGELEMRLHILAEDAAASLAEQTSLAARRVPATVAELRQLEADVNSLRAAAAEAEAEAQARASGPAAAAAAELGELSQVRARARAAAHLLRETSELSRRLDELEARLAAGDAVGAAPVAAAAARGLAIVGDSVPELRDGPGRLARARAALAAQLEPRLGSACASRDAREAARASGALHQAGQAASIGPAYLAARAPALPSVWAGAGSRAPYVASLPDVYADLVAVARAEKAWVVEAILPGVGAPRDRGGAGGGADATGAEPRGAAASTPTSPSAASAAPPSPLDPHGARPAPPAPGVSPAAPALPLALLSRFFEASRTSRARGLADALRAEPGSVLPLENLVAAADADDALLSDLGRALRGGGCDVEGLDLGLGTPPPSLRLLALEVRGPVAQAARRLPEMVGDTLAAEASRILEAGAVGRAAAASPRSDPTATDSAAARPRPAAVARDVQRAAGSLRGAARAALRRAAAASRGAELPGALEAADAAIERALAELGRRVSEAARPRREFPAAGAPRAGDPRAAAPPPAADAARDPEAEALLPLVAAAQALDSEARALRDDAAAIAVETLPRLLAEAAEAEGDGGEGADDGLASAAALLAPPRSAAAERVAADPRLRASLRATLGAASGAGAEGEAFAPSPPGSAPAASLFARLLASAARAVSEAEDGVAAALTASVEAALAGFPEAARWERDEGASGDLALPTFSPLPMPYVTALGEYILSLPQLLEAGLLGSEGEEGEGRPGGRGRGEGGPRGEGDDDDGRSDAEADDSLDLGLVEAWTGRVARVAAERYLAKLGGIRALSASAGLQLAADLEYFCDVLGTIGVEAPPALHAWAAASAAEPDHVAEVVRAAAEGGDREAAAAAAHVSAIRSLAQAKRGG